MDRSRIALGAASVRALAQWRSFLVPGNRFVFGSQIVWIISRLGTVASVQNAVFKTRAQSKAVASVLAVPVANGSGNRLASP
jgi:hypothetical protein